ncbi:M23 family metallopeptidase [Thioflexithrix psekupsensis]|uniref:M23ase beta-sheet core domain-containing protein n=1 Tax=Thioflexithrix psekupsensis TaxID=1570016 RepID=A0A251X3E6_9GAMM|nr:M23 family metallopeptidase [Thioflexithrix psekupsensis]OUD11981.1 hypothetical protein TPSD3_12600 [Thioflexithrix psekupsensis]
MNIRMGLRKAAQLAVVGVMMSWYTVQAQSISGYYAPYAGGTEQRVSQDGNGTASHYGAGWAYAIDFAGVFDVHAPKEGVVEMVGQDSTKPKFCLDNPRYWNGPATYIRIKHPDGLYSYYFHLSKTDVTVNQRVERGQKIGVSGNTGCSTAAHLHFQLSKQPNMKRDSSVDVVFDDIGKPKSGKSYLSKNYRNSQLSRVVVNCPLSVNENSSNGGVCKATAYYTDNSSKTVTPSSWSDNSTALSVSTNGTLSTTNVNADTNATITGSYSENGKTMQGSATVKILNALAAPIVSIRMK